MTQSMTGYGKGSAVLEAGMLTVEIRTLNGKNADISIKSSYIPKDKELALRKKIADRLNRGTIDVFVTWEASTSENAKAINSELAQNYYSQIQSLCKTLGVKQQDNADIISTILRLPDVVDSKKSDIITEENWPLVDKAFDEALDNLVSFRIKEGEILKNDLLDKIDKILAYSLEIESLEKERIDSVRERILTRLEELKASVDEARVEQEMIFYIEKLDINEERVRLRQHCAYFKETMEVEQYPGRKLGFIAQEMGREINTTGSKANHARIQKIVTCMKDELEKIKEQSLNIL